MITSITGFMKYCHLIFLSASMDWLSDDLPTSIASLNFCLNSTALSTSLLSFINHIKLCDFSHVATGLSPRYLLSTNNMLINTHCFYHQVLDVVHHETIYCLVVDDFHLCSTRVPVSLLFIDACLFWLTINVPDEGIAGGLLINIWGLGYKELYHSITKEDIERVMGEEIGW